MITCSYERKFLECPVCGSNETWDLKISDWYWMLHVNEFIAEHKKCKDE